MSVDALVSAVIPTYNCAQYLPEAMESVLAQSTRIELVVVDDGSDDCTGEVVQRFGARVHYVRQDRQGAGAARNRGAAIASGEYLAFLDADDLWPAGRLARQVRFLEAHPGIDMVFGHAEEFYSPDLTDDEQRRLGRRDGANPFYSACTMAVRRGSFERTGGFTSTWKAGEFVDWYLRATDSGMSSGMLPDVVLRRRIHRGHIGKRTDSAAQDYVRIIRHSLERRRAAAGSAGAAASSPGAERTR